MTQTRLTTRSAIVAVASAALLVSGCGSDDGSSPQGRGDPGAPMGDLAGASFVSTHVTKDGSDYSLVTGTHLSIRFSDTGLDANAGCNLLGGDAALRNGVIAVSGGLSMTEMGCAQQLMRQDTWFADLLSNRPAAALDGDTLTLTSGDGQTVVEFLNDDVANPDRPLVGTTWTLDAIGGSDPDSSVSSVPEGVTSTLEIDDGGRVSIRPGCNTGGGTADVGDGVITFGPIALTEMACAGPQSDIEAAVLAVVDGAVDYSIDADALTLTKDGATLTYRAR